MIETLEVKTMELSELHRKWQTIFMWQDGPLVHAMKDGDLFLVDEISLADDSVLERLNSVLEPEGTLVSWIPIYFMLVSYILDLFIPVIKLDVKLIYGTRFCFGWEFGSRLE